MAAVAAAIMVAVMAAIVAAAPRAEPAVAAYSAVVICGKERTIDMLDAGNRGKDWKLDENPGQNRKMTGRQEWQTVKKTSVECITAAR